MDFGIANDEIDICSEDQESYNVDKVTVESALSVLGSGIGLDIAKNHTGVTIYVGGKVKRYGFALDEYDNSDYFGDYKMRLSLKNHLKEIVGGMEFNYCIVEDVYGGENYDTVRKLIVLNTVIDELIFEGTVKVTHFYRWLKTMWFKYFKLYYKTRKNIKSKIATQDILGYLEDEFYLQHRDLENHKKEEIFFEDICDSTAMLCGLALYVSLGEEKAEKKNKISMKNIKMTYIEYEEDYLAIDDDRMRTEAWVDVETCHKNLEDVMIQAVTDYPKFVLRMDLPVKYLGKFGIKYKLPFYPSGNGVLLWYLKHS